jgi:hypothetical protein
MCPSHIAFTFCFPVVRQYSIPGNTFCKRAIHKPLHKAYFHCEYKLYTYASTKRCFHFFDMPDFAVIITFWHWDSFYLIVVHCGAFRVVFANFRVLLIALCNFSEILPYFDVRDHFLFTKRFFHESGCNWSDFIIKSCASILSMNAFGLLQPYKPFLFDRVLLWWQLPIQSIDARSPVFLFHRSLQYKHVMNKTYSIMIFVTIITWITYNLSARLLVLIRICRE